MDPIRLPSLRDLVDMPPATHSVHRQPRATAPLWTAINHRPEDSAPVSPPTQTANHHLKPNLSPSSQRQEETWNHHHDQVIAIPSPVRSIEPKPGRLPFDGTSSSSSGEHQTAEKPITAERQDSAVFTSAPCLTTTTPARPGNASFQVMGSPETHRHSALRSAPSHPTTPPAEQAHTVCIPTLSATHDRQWELPSTNSPLPRTALFVNEKNNNAIPSHTSVSQPPSGVNKEECAYCGSKWSFPPPDSTTVKVKSSPNPDQMDRIENAMRSFIHEYKTKKEADFKEWENYHQSCRETKAQTGSKRRPDEPMEELSLPFKSRKLSSESPPRRSRSPPIEPPSNPGSTNGENTPASFYFKAKNGPPVQVSSSIASMLKIDGAPPPPQYIPLANDSSNMFHDPPGRNRKVAGRGGTSTSRRGTFEETAH